MKRGLKVPNAILQASRAQCSNLYPDEKGTESHTKGHGTTRDGGSNLYPDEKGTESVLEEAAAFTRSGSNLYPDEKGTESAPA